VKLGFIGAGNMASALARGIGEPVLATDVVPGKAEALVEELGGEALASPAEVAAAADAIVLAHKPAQLADVAEDVGGAARAVVSILGGTPIAKVETAYPGVAAYRFLPNIPVELRQGVFCYWPGALAADGPEDELLELFGRTGRVVRLPAEALIEPAMALMSCGPAFMALVAEALVDAGVRHGLDRADAAAMVIQTMAGSAAVLAATQADTAGLRTRVASPGGSTERGLAALEAAGLRSAFDDAVDAVVEFTRR
jgi:pyrroline-5-carboxylate reductase